MGVHKHKHTQHTHTQHTHNTHTQHTHTQHTQHTRTHTHMQVSPCDVIYQPGDFVIHYSGAFGRSEYYTNGTIYKRPYGKVFRFVSGLFQVRACVCVRFVGGLFQVRAFVCVCVSGLSMACSRCECVCVCACVCVRFVSGLFQVWTCVCECVCLSCAHHIYILVIKALMCLL